MAVRIDRLSAIIAALSAPALAGCALHSYGLTVPPGPGYGAYAQQYLDGQGFGWALPQAGDELSMERQHGDSVDRISVKRGTMSDWPMTFSPGAIGAGGSGVYPAPGPSRGLDQTSVRSGPLGSGHFGGSGRSSLVTVELNTYRVDAKGGRHAIEPSNASLAVLDSVIALVQPPDPAPRH